MIMNWNCRQLLVIGIVLLVLNNTTIAQTAPPQQECGPMRYTYTPCETTTGIMYAVTYFVEAPVTCTPPTALPLLCNTTCRAGQFLAAPHTACSACPAGTYSELDYVWRDLDRYPTLDLYASSSNATTCGQWHPELGVLTSGNQSDGCSTTLAMNFATATRDAVVSFDYRTSTEAGYDRLVVMVDHVPLVLRNGLQFDSGRMSGYTTVRAVVPESGPHSLVFTYTKDQSRSVGDDQVYVRGLKITNVTLAPGVCNACPAGSVAPTPGSALCSTCPRDTVPNEAATSCGPCPSDKYSRPGMTQCLVRPVCRGDVDYDRIVTPCDAETRMRNVTTVRRPTSACGIEDEKWNNVTISELCAPCEPGTTLDTEGMCVGCQLGMTSDGASECTSCGVGTAAVRRLTLNPNTVSNGLPSHIRVSCSGSKCPATTQALVVDVYHDAEYNNGQQELVLMTSEDLGAEFKMNITLDVTSYSAGTLTLDYGFLYSRGLDEYIPVDLGIYIDDTHHRLTSITQLWPSRFRNTYTQSVPLGEHNIKLSVDVKAPIDSTLRFVLFSLQLSGVVEGTAAECLPCPAGTSCPASSGSFLPCVAGSTSPPQAQYCEMCEGNRIAPRQGMVSCIECPNGTLANDYKTSCTKDCTFSFTTTAGDVHFDLGNLSQVDLGPLFIRRIPTTDVGAGRTEDQSDELLEPRLFMNLCGPLKHQCTETPDVAMACLRSSEWDRTVQARAVTFSPIADGGRVAHGFEARYSLGSECFSSQRRTMNVRWHCNPEVSEMRQVAVNTSDDGCHFDVTVESRHGCATCEPHHYEWVRSSCGGDNLRVYTPVLKPSFYGCIGAAPEKRVEPCRVCDGSDYRTTYSSCDGGERSVYYHLLSNSTCEERAPRPDSVEVCHTFDVSGKVNVVSVSVSVVCLVVVSLMGVVVLLVRRSRRLAHQYESLANRRHDDAVAHNELGGLPTLDEVNENGVVVSRHPPSTTRDDEAGETEMHNKVTATTTSS
eukprot:PhM_4_TR15464/c0_g1_i1/m.103590